MTIFPVDDAAVGQVSEHGGVHVGEIAIQRRSSRL
jgi:hypothetical protein